MKNNYIIKKREEFDNIIQNGKRIHGKLLTIHYYPSEDNKKYFGFAIGKKIGNAVERNFVKRRLRMIIHNNQNLFSNKYKYIIMIKKECFDYPYNIWNSDMIDIIGKAEFNEKN